MGLNGKPESCKLAILITMVNYYGDIAPKVLLTEEQYSSATTGTRLYPFYTLQSSEVHEDIL